MDDTEVTGVAFVFQRNARIFRKRGKGSLPVTNMLYVCVEAETKKNDDVVMGFNSSNPKNNNAGERDKSRRSSLPSGSGLK